MDSILQNSYGYPLVILFIFLGIHSNSQKEGLLDLPIPNSYITSARPFLSINVSLILFMRSDSDSVVRSCQTGSVVYKKLLSGGGWSITVKSDDTVLLHYSNLVNVDREIGEPIKKGDKLGSIKPGDALHFQATKGVWEIDPRKFIKLKNTD